MTALEKYLLEGLHKVTLNNELCPIVHMVTALRWALLHGASENEARMYSYMERESLISKRLDDIMDQQEQMGKARLTVGKPLIWA